MTPRALLSLALLALLSPTRAAGVEVHSLDLCAGAQADEQPGGGDLVQELSPLTNPAGGTVDADATSTGPNGVATAAAETSVHILAEGFQVLGAISGGTTSPIGLAESLGPAGGFCGGAKRVAFTAPGGTVLRVSGEFSATTFGDTGTSFVDVIADIDKCGPGPELFNFDELGTFSEVVEVPIGFQLIWCLNMQFEFEKQGSTGEYLYAGTYDIRVETLPTCGNGLIETGEQCDDGNIAAGDCCSAACQFEAGPGSPGCCIAGTCNVAASCGAFCFGQGSCQLGGSTGEQCLCLD